MATRITAGAENVPLERQRMVASSSLAILLIGLVLFVERVFL